MHYNLNIKYKNEHICEIKNTNISKLIEETINVFNNTLFKDEEFKNLMEKKFQVDYLNIKNQKKVPFGYLPEEFIKDKNLDEIKNHIKEIYTTNSGVSGELKISEKKSFFMFSGKFKNAEQNIIDTINSITNELSNIEIKYQNKTYKKEEDLKMEEKYQKDFYNKIFFGPTGTGKSWLAEKLALKITENKKENILRVTFHPEFDYSDFFGQYKPVVYETDSGSNIVFSPYNQGKMEVLNSYITYSFTYGIFLESVLKALAKKEEIVLLIEEINRGNCSAIFGDLLQLLDRDEFGDSKYKLNLNIDMKRYLLSLKNITAKNKKENSVIKGIANIDLENSLNELLEKESIYIPQNLTIIATMNNSDQSLYPMDSAFKRRWIMEYIPIDYKNEKITIENSNIKWSKFLFLTNSIIKKELRSEDKTIGQWFIIPKENKITEKDLKNKLISYLYFDVFKHYDGIFDDLSYSEIMNLKIDEIFNILEKTNKE